MAIDIKKLSALIEKEINKLSLGKTPKQLYDPLYYILALGGKRIRPLLTLLSYSLYKDDAENIIHPALAVEVFHNFTLMHDDIMDKAPLRRGQATVHEKWNTNIAILSGDVMMIKAYDLLFDLDESKFKQVMAMFNECARLVCEGQQLDMDFETQDEVSEAAYLNMIKLKTAVLLGFSLKLGVYLSDAPDRDCRALDAFGTAIGIGFQLKDDLLDVYGEQAEVGKQVGGDIISNKKTYLLIKALELANPKQKEQLDFWLSEETRDPQEKVLAITAIYDELQIKQLTEQEMNKQYNQAFASLHQISASEQHVEVLEQFSKNLINRDK